MEFRNLILTTLLAGLFIFAMISGSVFLALDNNANNSLLENEAINSTFMAIQQDLNDSAKSGDNIKSAA